MSGEGSSFPPAQMRQLSSPASDAESRLADSSSTPIAEQGERGLGHECECVISPDDQQALVVSKKMVPSSALVVALVLATSARAQPLPTATLAVNLSAPSAPFEHVWKRSFGSGHASLTRGGLRS